MCPHCGCGGQEIQKIIALFWQGSTAGKDFFGEEILVQAGCRKEVRKLGDVHRCNLHCGDVALQGNTFLG